MVPNFVNMQCFVVEWACILERREVGVTQPLTSMNMIKYVTHKCVRSHFHACMSVCRCVCSARMGVCVSVTLPAVPVPVVQ